MKVLAVGDLVGSAGVNELKVRLKEIKEKENISTEMANITRNEFSKIYSDWEIKNFSNTDVELYKDFSGNCGEHFLVKSSLNGFLLFY